MEGLEDRHNNMEDAFCKTLGKDPKTLELAFHEQLLLKSLDFTLHVHTPVSSIEAILFQLGLEPGLHGKVWTLAIDHCWFTYRVKRITFCFTPGVIAIYAVNRALRQTDINNT